MDHAQLGFYELEPNFFEEGVWVSDVAFIPTDVCVGERVVIQGLYFPKLIEKQTKEPQGQLVISIGDQEIHSEVMQRDGLFDISFLVPALPDIAVSGIQLRSKKYFIPAHFDGGSDYRRLAWRLRKLQVGARQVFDCTRRYNIVFDRRASWIPETVAFAPDARGCSVQIGSSVIHLQLDSPLQDHIEQSGNALVFAGRMTADNCSALPKLRIVVGDNPYQAEVTAVGGLEFHESDFSVEIVPPIGLREVVVEVEGNDGIGISVCRAHLFHAPRAVRSPQETGRGRRAYDLVRRKINDSFLFRPRPLERSKTLANGAIQFHLNTPKLGSINLFKRDVAFTGWAVNFESRTAARVRIWLGDSAYLPRTTARPDVRQVFSSVCELPLDTGFSFILTVPVGVYRMRIEVAASPDDWHPALTTTLFRVPGISASASSRPSFSYDSLVRLEARRLEAELPDIMRHVSVMLERPLFAVVIDVRVDNRHLASTLASIRHQSYPYFQIALLAPSDALHRHALSADIAVFDEASLDNIAGDFAVFIGAGHELSSNALYEFASTINQHPDVDLVYGDEDTGSSSRRRSAPFYKPGWSPDYLETFNYIGFPACYRSSVARSCLDHPVPYDFILRFTERTSRIRHVAKILGHSGVEQGRRPAVAAQIEALEIQALTGRLRRTGRRGVVTRHESHGGCYDIRLDLKTQAAVSIIIPTAGRSVTVDGRSIDLVCNLVAQIVELSTYKNLELVIVDNGDLSDLQIQALADAGCRRVTFLEPVFNISKKLNLGASIATGDLLVLMNDDIEILTPDWIERLLEQFEKPHVGVVGAKLLYPGGRTQHVGVVFDHGNPDHVRRSFPRDDTGYFFSTCGVRNYSAVTGACMMTTAKLYREVGGYTEELAVSYNDIDYCLKVREKGLWVVYAPAVELTHMESVSRNSALDYNEAAFYHRRWASAVVRDDFYAEDFLTLGPPTFEASTNPRLI